MFAYIFKCLYLLIFDVLIDRISVSFAFFRVGSFAVDFFPNRFRVLNASRYRN